MLYMSDNTIPTPVAPPAQKTDANAVTAPANTDAVSRAEFAELKNSLSRLIRNSSESLKKTPTQPQPQPSKDDGADSTKTQIAQLQAQLAENERKANDRIAAAETKDRQSALRSAIGSHGLGEVKAKILFHHVLAEHGENIKIEDGEVVFDDPVRGTKSSVSDLIDQTLSGPAGDMFKPAPGAGANTK